MRTSMKAIVQKAIVATTVLFFPFASVKADIKIATVDINRILNQSKEAEDKKRELDTLKADATKKIEAKQKTLRDLQDKIKTKNLSEDSKEATEFKNVSRELERMMKDAQEDLREKFFRVNKTLTDKAMNIVSQYAKENDFDLVLEKSAKERGPVLYGDSGADITDAVIKRMNQ